MPREFELAEFEKLYKSYNVTDVVRTCEECHYSDDFLKSMNIENHVGNRFRLSRCRFLFSRTVVFLLRRLFSNLSIFAILVLVPTRRTPRLRFLYVFCPCIHGRFIAKLDWEELPRWWRFLWSSTEWRTWMLSRRWRSTDRRLLTKSSYSRSLATSLWERRPEKPAVSLCR